MNHQYTQHQKISDAFFYVEDARSQKVIRMIPFYDILERQNYKDGDQSL